MGKATFGLEVSQFAYQTKQLHFALAAECVATIPLWLRFQQTTILTRFSLSIHNYCDDVARSNGNYGERDYEIRPTDYAAVHLIFHRPARANVDNYRITALLGDNQARIVQLVWRLRW